MADQENWPRLTTGEYTIEFDAPDGASKPRRVTREHVYEFNRLMEQTARTYWTTVDKKKPYALKNVHFRSRYSYIAVDTDQD